MKIKRTDQTETNKTTAFWLHEFAYDLEKKAKNVDYLKEYLDKNYKKKKFNTIDEKLADIKERVGFDLAKKITNEIEKTSSESNSSDCGCTKSCTKCKEKCDCKPGTCSCSVKTASEKNSDDVAIMNNILKYIKDMIGHEPHLTVIAVLDRCRKSDGLKYNNIAHKIDSKKLVNYIEDLLKTQGKKVQDSLDTYIPQTDDNDYALDNTADYAKHAEPVRS